MEESMAQAYRTFGSFILFKEFLADELGHLYRAAEFDNEGIKRTVWLRVFDGPHVPTQDLLGSMETANRVGEILQAANVAGNPVMFEENGVPALAWDYLASQPLARVLDKVREEGFPVPVDNALLILEKLSLALSAALTVELDGSPMAHGFLHPGLIVVSNDGEGLVAGFGAANQLLGLIEHPEAADRTVPYLAPEVVITRTASRRGDVYSLGAILYQLLTAEPLPSQPDARPGVLDKAQLAYDEQPIPDDIKSLLERALAARPEERFSSAADFKKELDKLLYGGAYSPTTFNLALFMDRLFRSEIEEEESDREAEAAVNVEDYIRPEPEPEPEPEEEEIFAEPPPPAGPSKGLFIGIGAAAIAVLAVVIFIVVGGREPTSRAAPTPTPEEIAAREEAERQKIQEMVDRQLQELLIKKEEEIRAELEQGQQKIAELEAKLRDAEKKPPPGQDASAAAKRRQELQRQLEAEKKAQEEQRKKAEEEKQRLIDQARKRAEAAAAAARKATPTPAPAVPKPQPTRVARVEEPTREPTAVPAQPTEIPRPPAAQPAATITENMFLDPSQVDTLPMVLKQQQVVWSRMALHSRRRGVIILQATVNASGKVEDVKVLRADTDGFGIPQSAMEAVRKYLFKPATKNGVKVKTLATVTIPYHFRSR
jgi:TonB family protein